MTSLRPQVVARLFCWMSWAVKRHGEIDITMLRTRFPWLTKADAAAVLTEWIVPPDTHRKR